MKFFLVLFIVVAPSLNAATDSKLTFEPLYGVETSLVRFPEPARYVTRAIYGARALYGQSFLSGEAEVTQSKSRSDHPSTDQKIEDTSNRLALGLRSTYSLNNYIGAFIRAGGRASQGETIVTTAGVSETKDNPLRIDPYAGTGIQLAFSRFLALSAGATLIRNFEGKYDSQYTLSLSARFGNP